MGIYKIYDIVSELILDFGTKNINIKLELYDYSDSEINFFYDIYLKSTKNNYSCKLFEIKNTNKNDITLITLKHFIIKSNKTKKIEFVCLNKDIFKSKFEEYLFNKDIFKIINKIEEDVNNLKF